MSILRTSFWSKVISDTIFLLYWLILRLTYYEETLSIEERANYMSSDQIQSQTKIDNVTYLKIWQTEQEHQRTRWTVVTFFLSISFAILGLSFQTKLAPAESIALRLAGLFIYWFAYALLQRFYIYTKTLRAYLMEMERSGRTDLDIQTRASSAQPDKLSTVNLILYFGLIYTAGVVLLWWLGI